MSRPICDLQTRRALEKEYPDLAEGQLYLVLSYVNKLVFHFSGNLT